MATSQAFSFKSRATDWPFKFADIYVENTGDTPIVAANEKCVIRVVALWVTANIAGTIVFQDGTAGVNLMGVIELPANGGFVLPYCAPGWFETQTINTVLNLAVTTSTSVDGGFVYQLVAPDIT